MAKGRLISTNFWMDGKVEDDFTPEDKYAYLWCLTNPHTNLCGCYEVSIKQIAHELGYNTDTVERLLKRLDGAHNVIRYSAPTKELLVLNWYRYNWNASEKLDKPLLAEIRTVKCDSFREYLADRYNERDSVSVPYEYWADQPPAGSHFSFRAKTIIHIFVILIPNVRSIRTASMDPIRKHWYDWMAAVRTVNMSTSRNISSWRFVA